MPLIKYKGKWEIRYNSIAEEYRGVFELTKILFVSERLLTNIRLPTPLADANRLIGLESINIGARFALFSRELRPWT